MTPEAQQATVSPKLAEFDRLARHVNALARLAGAVGAGTEPARRAPTDRPPSTKKNRRKRKRR
jgi:hypothetical protein